MSDITTLCRTTEARLSNYLDDELDAATRAAVAVHLGACQPCARLAAELEAVIHAARALPRSIEPERDLWEGIAQRIQAPVVPLHRGDGGSSPGAVSPAAAGAPSATPSATRATPARATPAHATPARATLSPSAPWRRLAAAAAIALASSGITYAITARVLVGPRARPSAVAVGPGAATSPVSGPPGSGPPGSASPVNVPRTDSRARAGETTPGAPMQARSFDATDPRGSTPSATAPSQSAPSRPSSTSTGTARLASGQSATRAVTWRYDGEIAQLQRVLAERRSELDPATVAVVERNLQIIDAAINQSRTALARNPRSRFLAEQLGATLDRKVELLRTAALLPSRT